MKTKLSKRERILLYVLAIVVIVGGVGYFLILPALNTFSELDTQISDAELNLRFMQNTIDSERNFDERIAESRQQLEASADSFFPAMTNDDVDKYVTGLVQKNGLMAESLRIEDIAAEENGGGLVTRKLVNITCSGRRNGFVALANEVYETPAIVLTSFELAGGADAETGAPTGIFQISFSVQLAIYEPLPDEYFSEQALYTAEEVASDDQEAEAVDSTEESLSDYL